MKILHVINGLGSGGAEKLVVEICNSLASEFPTGLFLLENRNSFFLEELDSRVEVYAKSANRFNPLNLMFLWKQIKNYDIIHAHLFPTLYFVTLVSFFYPDKKFVFTEHNTTNSRRKISYLKLVERMVYGRYHKIICISDAVKHNLSQWIWPAKKVVLLYNFINEEKIIKVSPIAMEEFGFSSKDKIITMVGSFSNLQKRQEDIINALAFLPLQFKVLFLGDGNRLDEYKDLAKEKNMTDRVVFLGRRTDVYSILKSSHFGVLASEWEGFGLVALEYMACGIPSLGSNVEGLNEVIRNSNCLFRKNDPKDLALKIISLNENFELYDEVMQEQKDILATFNQNLYLKKLIVIYNSL